MLGVSFDPLALVPDDKLVVLGLVTTKTPRVETEEQLEQRITMASRVIDLERARSGGAMRLLHLGGRQPDHRRGRAAQARGDRADRGARLATRLTLPAPGSSYSET